MQEDRKSLYRTPERGVFKTIDGNTWEKVLYTNDSSGVADMVMDPSNPNKLIAAMWYHKRTPRSFKSGGKGSGLYMTLDAVKHGENWGRKKGCRKVTGRSIHNSRSNPDRIYARRRY
jgi:hypothetical protein